MIARMSLLDLKLGLRMLVKYPGLTVVGGLGMAVAVAIGGTFFDLTGDILRATLPFEAGERVVAIEVWDAETQTRERRILHDYAYWGAELKAVDELGAWRPIRRNLIVPGGSAMPVAGAEMTASGFRLARVRPLLGRTLVADDELEAAPPVVVIGYALWQTRFGGDSAVVGREVRLGNAVHTVIGVMPEGFGFPVNHGLWIPFRADPAGWGHREGPEIYVFGRLAPGRPLDEAQAELTTLGRQRASAYPETHERLRPRVLPYTLEFAGDPERWAFHLMQLLIVLLLAVVCVNVAVLVYARTTTRVGEIAVRTALGASRRRIVAQLFAEALVLSLAAAAAGLGVASLVLGWLERFNEQSGSLPFWVDFGLSTGTVAYVVGLAVLAAAIVGIAPALKATGRRLQAGLRELGGATEMRLGRTWTALIVMQVAVAVAILPGAVYNAWNHVRHGFDRPGFAAEEFLTAHVALEREPTSSREAEASEREFAVRYGDRIRRLQRQVEGEADVANVTFASYSIGQELPAAIEVEGIAAPAQAAAGHRVRFNHVDVAFFDAFDVPILAGRGFHAGDLDNAADPVIVNRAFVEKILQGRNALGRRLRYIERHRLASVPPGEGADRVRWYEIVGVVSDVLATGIEPGETDTRLYHPASPERAHPMTLNVRLRAGAPAQFAPRLRQIAADVDPELHLREVLPLDEALRQMQRFLRGVALAIALVTLSVLLLSAAGIHALMSFTVARRRREIGIRAALGAEPRRLLASVFSRALGQLAVGVAIGTGAALLVERVVENLTGGKGLVVVPIAAALMLVVGLLATLGPARRGLQIEPTEALKADV